MGQSREFSCAALPPEPQKDVKELEASARHDIRAVEAAWGKVCQGQDRSVSLWGLGRVGDTSSHLSPSLHSLLPASHP